MKAIRRLVDSCDLMLTLSKTLTAKLEPGETTGSPALAIHTARRFAAGERVGKYLVKSLLGEGGQGSVYLAHDPDLDREVVLKLHSAASADDARIEARREGRALAAVRSEYVARCFDVGEVDGTPYLVLEHLSGQTLTEVLDAGRMRFGRAVEIAAQIAQGLADVHARGVLHRDVKPSNIIVGSDGVSRLVDFGMAEPLEGARRSLISGTFAYMSPEQARGYWREIGVPSDIFGLGAVLYEMLTERAPYDAGTVEEILAQARRGVVPPPRSLVAEIPSDIDEVCSRALSPRISNRFATALEFREALLAILAGRPASRAVTRSGFRWWRIPRRRSEKASELPPGSDGVAGTPIEPRHSCFRLVR